MGKAHCDHRLVLRDPSERIVSDESFDNFAQAKPEYDQRALSVATGYELTLQHGARVILRTPRKET